MEVIQNEDQTFDIKGISADIAIFIAKAAESVTEQQKLFALSNPIELANFFKEADEETIKMLGFSDAQIWEIKNSKNIDYNMLAEEIKEGLNQSAGPLAALAKAINNRVYTLKQDAIDKIRKLNIN